MVERWASNYRLFRMSLKIPILDRFEAACHKMHVYVWLQVAVADQSPILYRTFILVFFLLSFFDEYIILPRSSKDCIVI